MKQYCKFCGCSESDEPLDTNEVIVALIIQDAFLPKKSEKDISGYQETKEIFLQSVKAIA